jgi:hypothetical protein
MSAHPVLVTGFAPYAGRGRNPAADIAHALDGCTIAEVPVVGRLLPVALDEIIAKAESLLDELQPRIVINVGLWPGESMVRIERVGLNLADFEIPDNHGRKARDEFAVAERTGRQVRNPAGEEDRRGDARRWDSKPHLELCWKLSVQCLSLQFPERCRKEEGYPLWLHSRAVPARAGGRSAPRTEEGGEARNASARRLRLDGFGDRHQGGGDCA